VLPRGGQLGHDLAVQVVGDDHAHRVDVVGLDDGLPARVGPLEPVPARGVAGEVLVDVGDRDQADGRQARREDGARRAVPVGVRPTRHACADDGDPDVLNHAISRLSRVTVSC
jgi:hypothetical protein